MNYRMVYGVEPLRRFLNAGWGLIQDRHGLYWIEKDSVGVQVHASTAVLWIMQEYYE